MNIGSWLRGLGLERFEQAFREGEIDLEILPELTEDDLKELGIPLGPRRKLLKAMEGLATEAQPPPVSAARLPEAERRQLTVMFVDLVGSTALSARLDLEDMRRVIGAYHDAVAREIARFDGYLAKYMGDGVLAYFGWPRAHEDDAERAVRAALATTAAVSALATPAGDPLRARIGIATGPVVVGERIGHGEASERTVVGETPNLAARLQELAEPGDVVLAERTRRLLGGLFAYHGQGTRLVKGLAEPQQIFTVQGDRAAEGRFDALHEMALTPLVGRDHELALLLDRWERAAGGEGQTMLLSGEAGVGKSRLLRALRERLGGRPHTWLGQFCSPYQANTALHPVIGLLERAAGLRRDDAPSSQLDSLEAMLALATPDVAGSAPILADLLRVPAAGRYPPLDLDPTQRKERTFKALLGQLAGLAARRPVLVLYEDVHWADPTTLELIGRVIEAVQRLPALAVVTFRPEFVPPWAGHGHVTSLSLGRLSRRQGEAMIERVSGGRSLPAEVLEEILARTDGVPLFVEELTRAVLESGALRAEADAYALAAPLPSLAIPSTLQDSLMARLDRLGPVKEIAQIAAVIGRAFSRELLEAAAGAAGAELDDALIRLEEAGLVFAHGADAYLFKHALVRDAAYQSLLKESRQRLHARIADTLEAAPSSAAVQPEILAHHCTEAGFCEKATACWLRAGRQAMERSANKEATSHFENGLALLDRLPEGARAELELDLLLGLAACLMAAEGQSSQAAAAAYKRARDLCGRLGRVEQLPTILQGLRLHYAVRGDLERALESSTELLELAERAGRRELVLEARRALGVTSFALGDFRAAESHLAAGLSRYDAALDRRHAFLFETDPGVTFCGYLGLVTMILGRISEAEAWAERTVEAAEASGHAYSQTEALMWIAWLDLLRGEPASAEVHASRAMALADAHGFQLYGAFSTSIAGWARSALGSDGVALEMLRSATRRLEALGGRLFRCASMLFTLDRLVATGDADAAPALAAELLGEIETIGCHFLLAEARRLRARALMLKAQPGAEALLCSALEDAASRGARLFELRAAVDLARLWAETGDLRKAADLLGRVYDGFPEGYDIADLKEAKALLDELR